jgi:hypothetical protein
MRGRGESCRGGVMSRSNNVLPDRSIITGDLVEIRGEFSKESIAQELTRAVRRIFGSRL